MKYVIILTVIVLAAAVLSVVNYRRFFPVPKGFGTSQYRVKTERRCMDINGHYIYGELLLPKGKKGRLPVVICSHGFGSSYKHFYSPIRTFFP